MYYNGIKRIQMNRIWLCCLDILRNNPLCNKHALTEGKNGDTVYWLLSL
jgi:hypothetical protein